MKVEVHGDIHIYGTGKPQMNKARTSSAMAIWKKKVKARDCKCQCCGEVPVNNHLEIHHIMPFSKYPMLATDEHNGVALCQKCHRKYHELYGGSEGADTFAEFMKKYGER